MESIHSSHVLLIQLQRIAPIIYVLRNPIIFTGAQATACAFALRSRSAIRLRSRPETRLTQPKGGSGCGSARVRQSGGPPPLPIPERSQDFTAVGPSVLELHPGLGGDWTNALPTRVEPRGRRGDFYFSRRKTLEKTTSLIFQIRDMVMARGRRTRNMRNQRRSTSMTANTRRTALGRRSICWRAR